MEKRKREGGPLAEAAERFDLPPELITGMPHIEVAGNRQFYMERHRGILSYSDKEIAINGEALIVRVVGEKLELLSMTGEALRIGGIITKIEWVP